MCWNAMSGRECVSVCIGLVALGCAAVAIAVLAFQAWDAVRAERRHD
jgi:hypothetical protein